MRETTCKLEFKCVYSGMPRIASLLMTSLCRRGSWNVESCYLSQSSSYSPVLGKIALSEWPLITYYRITLNTDTIQLSELMDFFVYCMYIEHKI